MLRFLHVCSINEQPQSNDKNYDPVYKVQEFMNFLESRYQKLFVPGQQLSLDESLIRAFGRMKFKVRIITKAARYGIKVYVLTDAVTAFVLKVIVYTGVTTYQVSHEDTMKTVQVVKELCKNYSGTYRTIYIDRFYTSIELLKSLDKIQIFVVGTCMKNRLPKELKIIKNTKEYKQMQRGDFTRHQYTYITEKGEIKKYGLVCWKDRDIVYCLTNVCSTVTTGSCYRRSAGGIVCLERPSVIGEYNKYMGGVDLADMRRLHCNSTIMGQNRWWLKLFFYLLDVGTSNALVLYRLSMIDKPESKLNIVDFKIKIIQSFVGTRITDISTSSTVTVKHELNRSNQRHMCAYCGLFGFKKRTRYKCAGCHVPLCSMGTGRTTSDCFTLCHSNDNLHKATIKRYEYMISNTNTNKKICKK